MMTRVHLLLVCLLVAGACGDNDHPGDTTPTAAKVVTDVTPNPVVAGQTLSVTCTVYDDDGNILNGIRPTLFISPGNSTITIQGFSVTITKAGPYAAQCGLPDLPGNIVPFDVVHAKPAKIMIARDPDQQVYGIGAVVTIQHSVFDKYDNPIPEAVVINTSTPVLGVGPTLTPTPDEFSYGGEGKYHIDAVVDGDTEGGTPVAADTDIIVNQTGPLIACGTPVDGSMQNITPGSTYTFTGTANDINGTMSVTVNGTSVPIGAGGTFSLGLATRFGINFVDIVATDTYGVSTTKVCTFLAANQWANPGSIYNDTIMLRLAQSAIDDGVRSGPINSLGDMLYTVENSQGLKDTLDSGLRAASPLEPMTCHSQVCIPFTSICKCVLSSEVDYNWSSLPGPNTDSLTLVTNGMTTTALIDNPVINLRVHGSVAGIGYDTTGNVNIDYIQVTLTLDIGLAGGHPHMAVRPGTVSTNVGSISTNFSGIDGFIINIIVSLANGTVRNLVRDQITSYVQSNFNAVLDGVVSGLDISTLGTTFNVPRLDGNGSVPLGFGIGFTTLTSTGSRALFGIGTQLTSSPGNMYSTLGVAVPPGPVLVDPSAAGNPVAIAAHIAIINQALHALWKADYFHATIDGSNIITNAPPGLIIHANSRLPPVASFDGQNVSLALGDVDVALEAPGIPPNFAVTLGVRAHTHVNLVGNDLSFVGVVLDEVHVSSDVIDLDAMAQMQVQDILQQLAQHLIDNSLNDSLPSLPIPSFALPASLATYGLPASGNLGISSPSLFVVSPDFTLRGGFAIQ